MRNFVVWEISSTRCMRTINVGGIVRSIDWNPNKTISLVAVAADRKLLLINPGLGDILIVKKTDSLLVEPPELTTTSKPPLDLVSILQHFVIFFSQFQRK